MKEHLQNDVISWNEIYRKRPYLATGMFLSTKNLIGEAKKATNSITIADIIN